MVGSVSAGDFLPLVSSNVPQCRMARRSPQVVRCHRGAIGGLRPMGMRRRGWKILSATCRINPDSVRSYNAGSASEGTRRERSDQKISDARRRVAGTSDFEASRRHRVVCVCDGLHRVWRCCETEIQTFSRINSAAFSAIMIVAALMLPPTMVSSCGEPKVPPVRITSRRANTSFSSSSLVVGYAAFTTIFEHYLCRDGMGQTP